MKLRDFRQALPDLLDGIYFEPRGILELPVRVVISEWKTATVERFNEQGANPKMLNLANSGELREICECAFGVNETSIAGFERHSGAWQRYLFAGPTIAVVIDD